MYAVHKLTSEQYLQVLQQTHGLRFYALRLSNPYGPHQPLATRGYGVLNQFMLAAARGAAITLYGDGCQRRDYIYVDDVMTAFLLCAASEQCTGQIFNLGGRQSIMLHAAAQQIARLAGGTPVHFAPWPEGYKAVETGDYCTDLRKIERYIALPPQRAFEEGLAQTLTYYRNTQVTSHTA
jgi:nucleoside-diphosphate-sugar epimerase